MADDTPPPAPPEAAPAPAPLPRVPLARFGLAVAAWRVLLLALVGVPAAVLVIAVLLLRSEDGTAWVAGRLPWVDVTAPRGALLGGGTFGADRIVVRWDSGRASVTIDGAQAEGAHWRFFVRPGTWVGVQAARVTARLVHVRTGPPSGRPVTLFASLRLPIDIDVAQAELAELRVDEHFRMSALSAREVRFGDADGTRHQVGFGAFEWDRLKVSGRAAIGADRPFAIDGALAVQGVTGLPWTAAVQARGPLENFELQATLRGEAADAAAPAPKGARAGVAAPREAPSLDAQVRLLPFAPWVLGPLKARTTALDLSALFSSAPQTRLTGDAVVDTANAGKTIEATLNLDNTLPGRWNEGRLPLRRAQLALKADPARRDRIELSTFDLLFGDAGTAAGRWAGSGTWVGRTLQLDTRITDLRPQALDGRAAAMRLSGPFAATVRGLPPADGSGVAGASLTAALEADLRSTLQGEVEGAPRPVTVEADATVSRDRIELRRARAVAGAASAELKLSLLRAAGARWTLHTEGRLADFDPAPWFPGREGSNWRKGPHRLNAAWKLDASAPAAALAQPPLQMLPALQGEGSLQVTDSLLAGVPVQAALALSRDPSAPQAQRSQLNGEGRLGSNRFVLEGRGDPAGNGEGDRLRLEVRAGALSELAPLAALDPAIAEWLPRQGSVEATIAADGRWPSLVTNGEAVISSLRVGAFSVARGTASWRVATGRDQPLELRARVSDAALGSRRLAQLRVDLNGTLRAHRVLVEAAAPLMPPAVLERMLALKTGQGTQGRLQGEGSWEPTAGGGGTWRGAVQRLSAGVWDGRDALPSTADASWLDTRELRAEVQVDADGELQRVQADAGRATLAGGVALKWDEFRWRAGGARPDFELRAELLPLMVAPYLQRAQVGVQIGGDLRVGAKVAVRAGERFDADVTITRQDGDLTVTESGTTTTLGLTDLHAEITAHDGLWRFLPLLNGRNVGTLSGAVAVRTSPQARWPGDDAALDGALYVNVPNLNVYAGWLPPGWRIEGELTSVARLEGRLGAPAYTGELRAANVGVRNLLLGVALSDGHALVALNGETARIEQFTVRAGEGRLTAEGDATFGSATSARLRATAERFRVLGRVDRQLVLSGTAALELQPDRLKLDGRLAVDSGLFDLTRGDAPTLDDDVNVERAAQAARTEPAAAPRVLRTAQVALDINLGERLRLRGRGLDTALEGELRVSTPGGRLAVNGTVNTDNGTYQAYGQKMTIERGIVAFSGPVDTARLDILALRPNLDTRVGVAITGTALTPRVRLYSEPDMSETDKLSWLVLGRAPDGLGRTDTALLQRAAVALLAGEGEGPTDQLMRAIGLDDISVRQSEGDVRDTVISLGKQLSRRWYVGYERGVNATAGTFQLIYRIAQRFTLRAQSGAENSLDVIWTWRFDRP